MRHRDGGLAITRRVLLLLLVIGAVVACGGGGTSAGDGDTSTTAATEVESIASFFGFPSGDDPEAAQAFYEAQEQKIQELIRDCMVEQGFEYIPAVYPQPEGAFGAFDQVEYAREQGFGITTWYGNEELQGTTGTTSWVDPNQEIVMAMSESESTAYHEALYGPQDQGTPQVDETTGETFFVQEGFGAGCYGQASEEIYGGQNQVYEEMSEELDDMYTRMQADPRITEANIEWASCMSGQGHEYESPDKMYELVYEDFQKRFDAIVGPDGGFIDPLAGMSQEEIDALFADMTEEEINTFYQDAQEASQQDIDQEALAALQQEEKDLAVAAAECSVELNELYIELSKEYEAEFIGDNRARLEEIRDADSG